MKGVILTVLTSMLWLPGALQAGGCESEGADPCTCECDKTVSIKAESTGLGLCRVQEEAENICSLLWNEGPDAVADKAEDTAEKLNQGSLDFPGAELIDPTSWNEFSQTHRPQIIEIVGRELDHEGAAVALLNSLSPDDYTPGSLHPSLSILLASHLSIIEFQSIDQQELEYDIHGLIWENSDQILQGMQSQDPIDLSAVGIKSGQSYNLIFSYGCFSANSDLVDRSLIFIPWITRQPFLRTSRQ